MIIGTPPRRVVTVTALAALAIAGCSSSSGSDPAKSSTSPSPTASSTVNIEQLPVICAEKATPITIPANFPGTFPLPGTAVITHAQQRSASDLVITAVDKQVFETTLKFFQTKLPAAGIKLAEGEVETDDAESNFTAATFKGRWQLRAVDACGDQTQVTILISKT